MRGVKRYNPSTNTFTDQADMIFERIGCACTVFNSAKHGGREVVYIGGGTNNYLTKAEILDHTITENWEQGKKYVLNNFYDLNFRFYIQT